MNNNIPQFSKVTPLIKRNAAWSSPEAIRWQAEVASKTQQKHHDQWGMLLFCVI